MKFTAEEILDKLINLLLDYLEELKACKGKVSEQFQYGEKTAYLECLEYIQMWEKAVDYNLAFDIEKRYPL